MPPNNNQQSTDPYGFIMNSPAKPPKKPLIDGTSMGTRIAVVAVGFIVLIIIFVVVSSFLGKASRAQTDRMVEVATIQSEIIRVSTLAEPEIRSSNTLNFAVNTKAAVQSSSSELAGKLNNRGIGAKKLAALKEQAKNEKTDKLLEDAATKNRYDETFLEIMNDSLKQYQIALEAAAGGATKSEKEILRVAWDGVETLKKNDPKAAANAARPTPSAQEKKTESSIIDNDLSAPAGDE